MKLPYLFSPFNLSGLTLPSRIVMAPMTRSRTDQPGNIPNEMMAKYYAQRASAGMIVTEATQISQQGQGYSFTPGIHSSEQVEGWKKVTQAVHQKGGRIFLQLWHVGRMSHESFHSDGLPIAPSAIAPGARVWVVGADGKGEMVECPTPRAMSMNDIRDVIEQFRIGARNAITAGFDGVEIHGANGYLLDQFMRSTSNIRTDEYGGSLENRIRFAVEVVKAVADEVGSKHTGIRLAPFIKQRGMDDPESDRAILAAAEEFEKIGIAYIHLAEADWDDAPTVPESFRHELRACFSGAIIVAGNYTPQKAESLLEKNLIDLAAFGRPFIANPDYPARIQHDYPLSQFDGDSLFGGTEKGYNDHPFYQSSKGVSLS